MARAKGKPRGKGRQFEKGNPGGPGRPPLTFYEKLVRGKVKEEFYEYLAKYWNIPVEQLEEISGDKKLSIAESWFISWFGSRVADPSNEDMAVIAKMLGINFDKMIIDHTSSDGSHTNKIVQPLDLSMLTNEQLKAIHGQINETDNE